MANRERGQVTLKATDKDYRLSFSINAMCELEDHFGEPITMIADRMKDAAKVNAKTFRVLLWAALLDNQPDITLGEAGAIRAPGGVNEIIGKIGEAFQAAFPPADKADDENPPATAATE